MPTKHEDHAKKPRPIIIASANGRSYGYIPDRPDFRDHLFSVTHSDLLGVTLPVKVDLHDTGFVPPIYDQGSLGSCTANALCRAFQFLEKKNATPNADNPPSRLQLYWHERFLEGTVNVDAGAQIRDGIKVLASIGVCDESLWPYDIAKFASKPSPAAEQAAKKHRIATSSSIRTLAELKASLAAGFPVPFGISVYESFEGATVAKSGIVPMPGKHERLLGGHAICATGYDDKNNWVICDNSWGDQWGWQGRFFLPYAYVQNADLASDFWSLRKFAVSPKNV